MKTLIPIPKIIERLQFENPWWLTDVIQQEYKSLNARLYFELFYSFVEEKKVKRAVVLMGPRRVGKTVMLYHAIDKLISEGTESRKVCFVSIDNPIYIHLSLEALLQLYQQAAGIASLDGCFVFFDEIQYLKDWERHLKILVDTYPNTKFIVSGSAAAALRRQSTESGAGRFTDFLLPPLTFHEYIHLKRLTRLIQDGTIIFANKEVPFPETHDMKALNEAFIHYLNFGGYPEVVLSEAIQNDAGRFVRNDIIDKVLLRDLPSLYGIKDVQELNRFFSYLAYNTGREFSYETIANESGMAKDLIRRYLEYLEAAFLIRVLHKVDMNAKHLKRIVQFKVYLTNSSLRTALFAPTEETDPEMGNMVETALLAQWMHRERMDLAYARWKQGRIEGEVDLISLSPKNFKALWAVEIKWSNKEFHYPKELKSLLKFCSENMLEHALVTTRDTKGVNQVEDLTLTFVPSALCAYNTGKKTLEKKVAESSIGGL